MEEKTPTLNRSTLTLRIILGGRGPAPFSCTNANSHNCAKLFSELKPDKMEEDPTPSATPFAAEGSRPEISPKEGTILAIQALEELHTERVKTYNEWDKYGAHKYYHDNS